MSIRRTYQGILKRTSIIGSPLFTDIVYVFPGPEFEKTMNQISERRLYSSGLFRDQYTKNEQRKDNLSVWERIENFKKLMRPFSTRLELFLVSFKKDKKTPTLKTFSKCLDWDTSPTNISINITNPIANSAMILLSFYFVNFMKRQMFYERSWKQMHLCCIVHNTWRHNRSVQVF